LVGLNQESDTYPISVQQSYQFNNRQNLSLI
jgi:hypothetical protein